MGAALFRLTDPDVFRLLIGVIAVAFVAYQAARATGWLRSAQRKMSDRLGMILGITAGFTSFISHARGPPAAIFLLSRELGKTGFQATAVIVFWAINLLKFAPYAMLGIFSKETLLADLYLVPAALFGVWTGVRFHRVVPEKLFFSLTYLSLTYLFLLATGSKLIWDALS